MVLTQPENSQICSKIADLLTQTYLGQGMHADETAALFSDSVHLTAIYSQTVPRVVS